MFKTNCASCGNIITRKRKSKTGLYFCSRECQQKEQRVGGLLQLEHYGTSNEYTGVKFCLNCGKSLSQKQYKYCCKTCAKAYLRNDIVNAWLIGKETGLYVNGKLSKVIRRYLIEKAEYKCERCGWGEVSQYTGNTPLEIHHRDGNHNNTEISNLEVLCPNCHSLTEFHGSLNAGRN